MRNRVRLLLAIITTLPLIGMSSVTMAIAQPDVTQTSTETAAPTTTSADKDEVLEDTKAADYTAKLQERLAARKTALKTKLTTAQQVRIKARCKASQSLIAKVSTQVKETNTSRQEVYANILSKLDKLSAKLKENGKDTTELDKNIGELKILIDKFDKDMSTLRQSAADISNMDCSADPSSFKASLESIRTAREAVAKDSVAIRTYVKDTLKVTIANIKTSVSSANSGGNQ